MNLFSPLHPIRQKRLSWYIKKLKPVVYYPLNETAGSVAKDNSTPKRISYSVTSITRSGTTATVTTAANHNLITGETIEIAGANETAYNGNFKITVTGANTFTYTVLGNPNTPATGTIVWKKDVYLNGVINGATIGQDGLLGKAYSFDGVNDYVSVAENSALRLGGGDFTIGGLFYMGANAFGVNDGTNPYLIAKSYHEQGGYFIKAVNNAGDGSNGKFIFNIKTSLSPDMSISITTTKNNYPHNSWYFVIGRYNSGVGIDIIVNGTATIGSNATAMVENTVKPFEIGTESSGSSHNLKGKAQHVFVFSRALTNAQITKLVRISGLS